MAAREAKKERKRKAKEAERAALQEAQAREKAPPDSPSESKGLDSSNRNEIEEPSPSEQDDPSAEEAEETGPQESKPPRTRWVFKLLGLVLLLFLIWLGYRWIVNKKNPLDLFTIKGQSELLDDLDSSMNELSKSVNDGLSDAGKWGLGELEKMISGKPPETKEEIAALVDESKQEIENEQCRRQEQQVQTPQTQTQPQAPSNAHKKSPREKTQPQATTGSHSKKQPSNAAIASAQKLYDQAIAHYIKADPRVCNITQAQEYIKNAKPLFERCLDECASLRSRGVRSYSLDLLEQSTAMRLYDCNKRLVMTAP